MAFLLLTIRSLDNVALDLREALHKCHTLHKLQQQVLPPRPHTWGSALTLQELLWPKGPMQAGTFGHAMPSKLTVLYM